MDSGERGMNPVATNIINPRKEYLPSWGSNQRPPVVKSPMLPTVPNGLCDKEKKSLEKCSMTTQKPRGVVVSYDRLID